MTTISSRSLDVSASMPSSHADSDLTGRVNPIPRVLTPAEALADFSRQADREPHQAWQIYQILVLKQPSEQRLPPNYG